MLSILATLYHIIQTYFQSLKRDLANSGHSKLTIICLVNFVGHPVILVALLLLNKIELPSSPWFYLSWLGVVVIALIQNSFLILGLIKTNFFGANSLASLSFVTTSLYAVLFLGETLNFHQVIALSMAFVGVMLLVTPKQHKKKLVWDWGLLFILFSLLIKPFGTIFYKFSALQTATYSELLTGRLVMDLIYYGIIYSLIFSLYFKKSPYLESKKMLRDSVGLKYVIGYNLLTLFNSWLIFKLPVTTLIVLSTISVPVSYFISKKKYIEKSHPKVVLATLLIVVSMVGFVLLG